MEHMGISLRCSRTTRYEYTAVWPLNRSCPYSPHHPRPLSVTAKIGEGGMREVHRARNTKFDRDLAPKVARSIKENTELFSVSFAH